MVEPPYDYVPITERDYALPDGANVVLWVVPNVEHFRFDNPRELHRLVEAPPDVNNHSQRDYGNRVGVWRLMDILDEYDVPGTVALNAAVCDHAPEVVDAMQAAGWEFMGHGLTNSQPLTGLTPAAERQVIQETRDRITEHTGSPPRGWLGPARAETFNTPTILAEAGFDYVCDYVNDDQPYRVSVDGGELVSIPYSTAISDKVFERGTAAGEVFEQLVKDQFDILYREGAATGNAKVMAISLHPYLIGYPYRSRYLANALEYITGHDVWVTTGGEIVDHFVDNY